LCRFEAGRNQDANSLTWVPPGQLTARPDSDLLSQQRLSRNKEVEREFAGLVDDLPPIRTSKHDEVLPGARSASVTPAEPNWMIEQL
jgi:hypothetical protein